VPFRLRTVGVAGVPSVSVPTLVPGATVPPELMVTPLPAAGKIYPVP
jgi:hypothetical protein